MFPRYFSGEITNWPRLPCYSLQVLGFFAQRPKTILVTVQCPLLASIMRERA